MHPEEVIEGVDEINCDVYKPNYPLAYLGLRSPITSTVKVKK